MIFFCASPGPLLCFLTSSQELQTCQLNPYFALTGLHLRDAVFQVQLREGDMSFADFLGKVPQAHKGQQPHSADAYDTCNILFSSGTTGKPS